VENGAQQTTKDAERPGQDGGHGSAPSVELMRAFVADQVFPGCLEWLRREGISAGLNAHDPDGIALFSSIERFLFFSEVPSPEASLVRQIPPRSLGASLADWRKGLRGVARVFRLHAFQGAKARQDVVTGAGARFQKDLVAHVSSQLRHNSDLVLILCLDYFVFGRQLLGPRAGKSVSASDEPTEIFEPIARIAQVLEQRPVDLNELHDFAQELVQRFRDQGYEWYIVKENTPYQEAMADRFVNFGHIETNQPVKTIKAALLRWGITKNKGMIRRVRSSDGVNP
jgi:hypothetical protein